MAVLAAACTPDALPATTVPTREIVLMPPTPMLRTLAPLAEKSEREIAAQPALMRLVVDAVMGMTEEEARANLSDRTRNVHDSGHGTQINYTSTDGRSFLWYPGNNAILPGFWKVERRQGVIWGTRQDIVHVCYRYGSNTYNPVTGSQGAGWDCSYAALSLRRTRESATGDVLGLTQRSAVPFVLDREPTTLRQIATKVGR
ncbi:MAG: hypothetical protein KF889_05915 [Alphaproteobacteria bacterium]|nr:hypothetical protein [Alphaproteobacteria bacterium]MCW5742407.1 hypothetical protein [Alphaproteobacteria bacterium]